jgi:ParB family chromosome partitioning protein
MKDQINRFLGFTDKQQNDEIKLIPVSQIQPSPFQPRSVFDDERIDELCQTIKTHGIIQPIVVRNKDNSYELIAGERRLRAVIKLGWPTIPAIAKQFNDSQAASVSLIENLQREGLTSIEEAIAYQKLIEIHQLTQESLAQRLGKSQSTIANKVRLLQLAEPIKKALLDRKLTERHARALLSLPNQELQLKMLDDIINKDLNVKQTEGRIKLIIETFAQSNKKKPKRISFAKDIRLALNTIRQSVDMVIDSGMNLVTDEKDYEDRYEIVIKIPKKPSP